MIFDFFDSPELLDIQRTAFHHFLKQGISQLLAKEFPIKVKNGNYSIELCLNEKNVKLVAPEDNPRDCILKMKTYNCKLYAQVKIICKKSINSAAFAEGSSFSSIHSPEVTKYDEADSKIIYQSLPEWVVIGQLPMMTKRGHFIINGSPRVIVHQVVRSPGIYFQKLIKKDDQNRARFYGDIIPLKGVWVRLQMTKKGRVEAKFKKGKKVEVEALQKCLQVIENQTLFKSIQKIPLKSFPLSYGIENNVSGGCRRRVAYKSPCSVKESLFQRVSGSFAYPSETQNAASGLYEEASKLLAKKKSRAESKAEHDAFVHTYDKLYRTAQDKELEEWQKKKKNQIFFKGIALCSCKAKSGIFFTGGDALSSVKEAGSNKKICTTVGEKLGRAQLRDIVGANELQKQEGFCKNKSVIKRNLNLPFEKNEIFTSKDKKESLNNFISSNAFKRKKCSENLFATFKIQSRYDLGVLGREKIKSKFGLASYKSWPFACNSNSYASFTESNQISDSSYHEEGVFCKSNAVKKTHELLTYKRSLYSVRGASASFLASKAKLCSRGNALYDLYEFVSSRSLLGRSTAQIRKPYQPSFVQSSVYKVLSTKVRFARTSSAAKEGTSQDQNLFFANAERVSLLNNFQDECNTQLTSSDLWNATLWLYKLRKGEESIDDIDHSQNRRVRTSGELLQSSFENGVYRLKNLLSTKLQEWRGDLGSSSFSSIFKSSYKARYNPKFFSKAFTGYSYTQRSPLYGAVFCSAKKLKALFFRSKKTQIPFFTVSHRPFLLVTHNARSSFIYKNSSCVQKKKRVGSICKAFHVPTMPLLTHSSGRKVCNSPITRTSLRFNAVHITFGESLCRCRALWRTAITCNPYKRSLYGMGITSFACTLACTSARHHKSKISSPSRATHAFRRFVRTQVGVKALRKCKKKSQISDRSVQFQKEKSCYLLSAPKIKELFSTKPITGALREFFGSNPLSQYMDQTNPLAEITHKRRISSLGIGGVSRESAGMAIRGIHPTHYGRICPIETPEGKNAGLVNSLAFYTKVDQNGFLKTPYYRVFKGQVQPSLGFSFWRAKEESVTGLQIAPSDLQKSSNNILRTRFSTVESVPVRVAEPSLDVFKKENPYKVQAIAISPIQMISVATSLIPFLEHNDANRALMGSNMQRQAVPLMISERPIVGTGLEATVILESGHITESQISGFVSHVTANKVIIDRLLYRKKEVQAIFANRSPLAHNTLCSSCAYKSTYKCKASRENTSRRFVREVSKVERTAQRVVRTQVQVSASCKKISMATSKVKLREALHMKHVYRGHKRQKKKKVKTSFLVSTSSPFITFSRSNQNTCITEKPLVREFDWVQKGDSLTDCSASNNGELAVGKNVLLAYIPWEGYNFEDAIVISDRLVREHVYTSLHIERYVFQAQDLKEGAEWFTKHLPGVESFSIQHLEESGLPRIGSFLKEGDIIVGKIRYLNKKPSSPYERLLCDILGEKNFAARNKSLYVPKGVEARVIYHKVISFFDSDAESKVRPLGSAKTVHLFLGEKRVIQVGDKISGRHGNKGVISTILPRQDMPYLPDGTPIDLILNPLGVPSRMNVGQVLECLLGLAATYLNSHFKISAFDERYGVEASKSIVFLKLYQARLMSGQNWLFQVSFPGKTRLVDGRSGECFDQWITVGKAYILKLIHMVSEKIHARSTGPYALITQQPLRGRSNKGGQRLGEMEVWALEGFGAAYTLQELLTKKSDDFFGRKQIVDSILPSPASVIDTLKPSDRISKNKNILGHPEIFKVLLCELQALCLDLGVYIVTPESFQRTFLGLVH